MPVPEEVRNKARQLNALDWIEKLDDWERSLGDPPTANNWHLTDLRHLGNLESAKVQGLLTPETPAPLRTRIESLEDNIRDWIEDHFPDEDESEDRSTHHPEGEL